MAERPVVLITQVKHYVGPAAVPRLVADGAVVVAADPTFTSAAERRAWEAAVPGATASAAQTPGDLVAEVVKAHGRLDAVISNDEFPAIRAPLDEAKLEDMRNGLEAMVVRPFALAQAAVPQMKKQGSGRIIFMTSAAPLRGLANYGMYATARGATNAMTVSLAKELAPHNIVVNAIAPNYMQNPSYFPPELLANQAAMSKMLKNIPLGRLGQPHEVAALVAFFAIGDCAFVTGHVVPIAGGWA